jgi:hypothetical protein
MNAQGDLGARKLDGFKPSSWRDVNSAVFVFDR